MKSSRLLFACLAPLVVATAASQKLPQQSPRVSTYRMAVELDPAEKTLTGSQVITWRNTTSAPTSELRFHLYLNAFKDVSSTHMRGATADFRRQWREDEFGWTKLERVELVGEGGSVDLTSQMRFVQPDDGNAADETVLLVPLPQPVNSGASIELHTEFRARLPKAYRRTGWVPGGGVYCMHWFPKLGVLEDRNGRAEWNCHQFHANTEFYADYSVYDVSITVPDNYTVGATGELQEGRSKIEGGRKTSVYRQEDVHDFAWVADPDFVQHEEVFGPVLAADLEDDIAGAVAERLGIPLADQALPATKIILLLHPEHDTPTQRRRHFDAVKCALEFFGARYGPYPYRTITVVDPARDSKGRRLGGGMEYPTLITCGTDLFPHSRKPSPEGVTIHEFGHQYWYGLSGNNEFTESWLDEGINTYSEGRAQYKWYGWAAPRRLNRMWPVQTTGFGLLTLAATPWIMESEKGIAAAPKLPKIQDLIAKHTWRFERAGFDGTVIPFSPLLDLLREQPTATFFREVRYSDVWNDRRRWLDADNPDHMVRPGWEYASRDSYVANSYHRPAMLLRTLERMVGRELWWSFLRRFHAQSRFGSPTTASFTELLGEVCGPKAAAFFDNAIRAEAFFDYGIDTVRPANGIGPRKEVVVRRFGALPADVRVRFQFEGREQPVYRSVGAEADYPWTRFVFDDEDSNEGPWGRLLEVWVDPPENTPGSGERFELGGQPAGVYLIDENLLNNAWRANRDRMPALYRAIRLLLQSQSQLSFAGLMG